MTFRIAAIVALLGLSCGSSGSYNSTCASSNTCDSPMVCPTAGPMTGRCTINCTKTEQCASYGGGECTSDVCVPKK